MWHIVFSKDGYNVSHSTFSLRISSFLHQELLSMSPPLESEWDFWLPQPIEYGRRDILTSKTRSYVFLSCPFGTVCLGYPRLKPKQLVEKPCGEKQSPVTTVLAEFPSDTQHWLACHVSGPSWKCSTQLPVQLPQLMSHLCQALPKFQSHEQNEWLLWVYLLHSNRQLTQYLTNINLKGSSTKDEPWEVE